MNLRVLIVTALAAGAAAPAPAAAEPALPADTFTDTVGVNVHVMHTRSPYWNLEATRSALRTLGVQHIRDGLRWYDAPARRWYNDELETRLGSLARSGARLNLLLPAPGGATGTTAQALAVAARLPGVQSIEAANEWDLNGPAATWPDEIRAHTREAKRLLRAHPTLRSTPLVAPGFGRHGSPITTGDLGADIDLGNGHPYANGGRPELPEWPGQWSLQRNIDTLRAVSGAKPFVLTEAGHHNALKATTGQYPVSEDVAAVYTTRTLLEHARLGAARTYLYELADSWDDPSRQYQEGNWGLFRADWSPKPAAYAVRNLLAVLRDSASSPRGAVLPYGVTGGDANLRTMAFARADGGFTIALWRAETIWNGQTRQPVAVAEAPMTVSFGRRFGIARVYRPTRGVGALDERRDVAELPVAVGADPVLVDLKPGATPTATNRVNAALRSWWCRAAPRWCPKR